MSTFCHHGTEWSMIGEEFLIVLLNASSCAMKCSVTNYSSSENKYRLPNDKTIFNFLCWNSLLFSHLFRTVDSPLCFCKLLKGPPRKEFMMDITLCANSLDINKFSDSCVWILVSRINIRMKVLMGFILCKPSIS